MYKIGILSDYPAYFRWYWRDETNPKSPVADHRFMVDFYCQERLTIYDSDSCGYTDKVFVVGKDGEFKFFKVHHTWEWEGYGTDEADLVNEFSVEEIPETEARKGASHWPVV